jgi:EAL domain-containing protein (putative c-di-GMP-specific phosphodiesterase class I)
MKIDGESIKRFSGNNKFKKVIDNILSIAKSIKIDTIAECVETKEQADFLSKNGCRFAQGDYYHKPMKPEEFFKLIKAQN